MRCRCCATWRFSLDGGLPVFEQTNVKLVKGWFENTFPVFLTKNAGAARFVHIDSDLYPSAATVLTHLRSRIVSDTVILFDEYFNYPAGSITNTVPFRSSSATPGSAMNIWALLLRSRAWPSRSNKRRAGPVGYGGARTP